jgi:hypothetical protein
VSEGSGKPELSVHDALVGEVLGEMVRVRQGVESLKSDVPQMVSQIKDAGELIARRMDDQARHIVGQLDERTKTLNAAANEFRDVRELLMGEVATKTTNHFETVLHREALRMAKGRRMELVAVGLGSAVVAALLVTALMSVLGKHV